jgi:hypothetical protein
LLELFRKQKNTKRMGQKTEKHKENGTENRKTQREWDRKQKNIKRMEVRVRKC